MTRKPRISRATSKTLAQLDVGRRLFETSKPCPSREPMHKVFLRDLQRAESLFYDLERSATFLVQATLVSQGIPLTREESWQEREGSGLPESCGQDDMFVWPERWKLLHLMRSVEQGDPTARSALRSVLEWPMSWEYPVALAGYTEEAYLALIGDSNRKRREQFVKRREAFEVAWGIESATTLERLLIKLISAAWQRLNLAEHLATMPYVQAVGCLAGLRDHARDQLQAAVKNLNRVKRLPSAGTDEQARAEELRAVLPGDGVDRDAGRLEEAG